MWFWCEYFLLQRACQPFSVICPSDIGICNLDYNFWTQWQQTVRLGSHPPSQWPQALRRAEPWALCSLACSPLTALPDSAAVMSWRSLNTQRWWASFRTTVSLRTGKKWMVQFPQPLPHYGQDQWGHYWFQEGWQTGSCTTAHRQDCCEGVYSV